MGQAEFETFVRLTQSFRYKAPLVLVILLRASGSIFRQAIDSSFLAPMVLVNNRIYKKGLIAVSPGDFIV